MKKFSFILLIAVAIFSFSCDSDDSGSNSLDTDYNTLILGKWKLVGKGQGINEQEQLSETFYDYYCGDNFISFYDSGVYYEETHICFEGWEETFEIQGGVNGYWEIIENRFNFLDGKYEIDERREHPIMVIHLLNSTTLKFYRASGYYSTTYYETYNRVN